MNDDEKKRSIEERAEKTGEALGKGVKKGAKVTGKAMGKGLKKGFGVAKGIGKGFKFFIKGFKLCRTLFYPLFKFFIKLTDSFFRFFALGNISMDGHYNLPVFGMIEKGNFGVAPE